jgi:hypothetical protein
MSTARNGSDGSLTRTEGQTDLRRRFISCDTSRLGKIRKDETRLSATLENNQLSSSLLVSPTAFD